MSKYNHIIYDIESYPNIFTICIGDVSGDQQIVYEISSRRNDFNTLLEALVKIRDRGVSMVGFNNLNYDYPVLHFLLVNATPETSIVSGEELANAIFQKSDSIIKSPFGSYTSVYEGDVLIPQIDLLKIHHFDNKNRKTGLKDLEFKMRSHKIQDLPITPGINVPEEMMNSLIEYNKFDVVKTAEFYRHSLKDIEFRIRLSEQLNLNVMNYNDTKIGAEFMRFKLESQLGSDLCYTRNGRKKVPNQTKRDEIVISDVIDPRVSFEDVGFSAVLNWLSRQSFKETKGALKDINLLDNNGFIFDPFLDEIQSSLIEESKHKTSVKKISKRTEILNKETGEVLYTFSNDGSAKRIKQIRSEYTDDQLEFRVIKHVLPKLCIPFRGMLVVYGQGGIHGSVHGKHVQSDHDWLIVDADVTSYYPSTCITTKAYPEHLSEHFLPVYASLIEERLQHPKGTVENAALKLALNGVYGKTNDKYSCFYDPQCTMKITLNGQLFLSMLMESLDSKLGDHVQFIQCNTDGITVRVHRSRAEEFAKCCNDWCQLTQLKLEYSAYDHMYIKDVNNYLVIKQDGSIKAVGDYKDPTHDWAKNHNQLVVYKTAVKYLTGEITDIRASIENHEDLFDFFFYIKKSGKTKALELHDEQGKFDNPELVQRRSRFLVTLGGKYLYKLQVNRVAEKAGWRVTLWNDLPDPDDLDLEYLRDQINYDYYVEEVEKLLKFEPFISYVKGC